MILPAPTSRHPVANAGDLSLGPDWWRSQAMVGARLRDLIAGIDDIGSFAIPYARLPRRLSTYSAELPRWADVAEQTPQDLLARPRLGTEAVFALIETGRDSVRVHRDTVAAGKVGAEPAVARLAGQLDQYDQALLEALVWPIAPVSQRIVAERLGVHPVSVTRNLPRARARFAELLADPAHHEVGDHANQVRHRLGPCLPDDVARVELRRLGIEPFSRTAEVLLHVAGPYARRGQWLESTAVPGGGGALLAAAVEAVFDGETTTPSTDALLRALTVLGVPPGVGLTYLEGLALKRFGDLWVRWPGYTTATMAEAALRLLGAPATPAVVLDTIGSEGGSLAYVNRVLTRDDRFVRVTRRTWGLRAWGVAEYTSIAHAIGLHIDARGGRTTATDVMVDLLASYPDITEASIRTILTSLEFVTEGGVIRRRTTADDWPPVPPLKAVRGAFHNGSNEIRVTVGVNSELLRGSGQSLHPAVATAAGVTPGQRRAFTSPHGEVTLSWRLSSTRGVNIGPLLPLATAVQATCGDTLVLALRTNDGTLDVTRLGSDDVGMARLRKLLGRPVRSPTAALATALRCRPRDVGAALRARGDGDLATMLDGT